MTEKKEKEKESCIICLDYSYIKNPIYLLSCGCKQSLFHLPCQTLYIQKTSSPISCPVCKRPFRIKHIYSFSYFDGPSQKLFWHVYFLFSIELYYSYIYSDLFLPLQSFIVFCLPFMMESNSSLDFFLQHIFSKYCFHHFIFFITFLLNQQIQNLDVFFFIGNVQVFTLFIIQYLSYPFKNPLECFIVSNRIHHFDILETVD
jgi:hypothetical protein